MTLNHEWSLRAGTLCCLLLVLAAPVASGAVETIDNGA